MEFSSKGNNHLSVSNAIFYLYVHGKEWIRENQPNSDADGFQKHSSNANSNINNNNNNDRDSNNENDELSISINRFVHRIASAQPQEQRFTRTESTHTGKIPDGKGEWIQFNVTDMVRDWISQHQQLAMEGITSDVMQEVVVKSLESWMRQLLILDTNSENVSLNHRSFSFTFSLSI